MWPDHVQVHHDDFIEKYLFNYTIKVQWITLYFTRFRSEWIAKTIHFDKNCRIEEMPPFCLVLTRPKKKKCDFIMIELIVAVDR